MKTNAMSCWITEAPQQFSPGAKDVQSPQERCQTIDWVMARTTQVPESPRSPSNPMDLNLLQDMVRPLDA